VIPTASLTMDLGSSVAVALNSDAYLDVSADGVKIMQNGSKVLFKSFMKPWKYSPSTIPDIAQYLMDFVLSIMSHPDKLASRLIVSVLITLLMDRNVPLVLFTGGPGVGKTTLMECLLRLIYGQGASVHKIPDRESDLMLTLDRERMIGLDNLEAAADWFHDLVCVAVTGGQITKRKLYTDKEMVGMTLKNLILLSAVDPTSIFRADVLSRMLVIECTKATSLRSEQMLFDIVDSQRDAVLSAIVDLAREHMFHVQQVPAHRLVDWYQHALSMGIPAQDIAKITKETDDKVTDRLPLIEAILFYKANFDGYPDNGIVFHTSLQQVLAQHSQHAALKHLPDTWRKLSRHIKQHSAIYERECGIKLIASGKNVRVEWHATSII